MSLSSKNHQGIGMTSQRTRNRLIRRLQDQGIDNETVLGVMRRVPRHLFVDEALAHSAYEDTALPIGYGQTISQPYIVALMTQSLLAPRMPNSVLEIGTGSGFVTACLAHLAGTVSSIDIYPDFAEKTRAKLKQLGKTNIKLETGDAMQLDADARYDAIAVTGSLPVLNARFERALRIGGRMFVVCGSSPVMDAMLVTRTGDDQWRRQSLFETDLPALVNSEIPPQFEF